MRSAPCRTRQGRCRHAHEHCCARGTVATHTTQSRPGGPAYTQPCRDRSPTVVTKVPLSQHEISNLCRDRKSSVATEKGKWAIAHSSSFFALPTFFHTFHPSPLPLYHLYKQYKVRGNINTTQNKSKTKFYYKTYYLPQITVKPEENPNFLKNGKMVISIKIRNFSRSRMMKRTSLLESSREINQLT